MKILIAEDDPVSVKILQFTLEHWGHEVICAANGIEAWQSFDAAPVRLIISDWMMPGLDGLELCRQVRARGRSRRAQLDHARGYRRQAALYRG